MNGAPMIYGDRAAAVVAEGTLTKALDVIGHGVYL